MPTTRTDEDAGPRLLGNQGLRLSGALLLAGFLFNALVTSLFHPSGSEDDHPAIFTEYADSDAWVAIHFGQFFSIAIALAGLLVLYYLLRGRGSAGLLALLGAAATVATGAAFAILQGLDGIALKESVEAWQSASGAERDLRFGDSETIRWLEWGFQSYFRILMGISLLLFGAALLASRLTAGWIGWVAVLAGLLSVATGIDVGYSGLDSGFGDAVGSVFAITLLIFAIGLLVAGRRPARERGAG